jgi:hypothetical protein
MIASEAYEKLCETLNNRKHKKGCKTSIFKWSDKLPRWIPLSHKPICPQDVCFFISWHV